MNSDNHIQTPYGVFGGVTSVEYYENGKIKSIRLDEENMIVTHAGELVPYYSNNTERRKYKASVSFYQQGTIQSVSLENQQEILTPIGEFPAELVTFYPTGELKRFFPLDGQINGFWSEEDERNLNIPFAFEFNFTTFTAMLVGIGFYKSGNIRSITLFPKETIEVETEYGNIKDKSGFSLYESGELESLEPAIPTPIKTPVGLITAYDLNSVGVNADSNSVRFDKEGRIISIITSSDKITVIQPGGTMKYFASIEKQNPLIEGEMIIIPLKLDFDYAQNTVTISNSESSNTFSTKENIFHIYNGNISGCNPIKCANCSQCSH